MSTSNPACARCLFFVRETSPLLQVIAGQCHRLPPTPVLAAGVLYAMFPPVSGDQWCYEYRVLPTDTQLTDQEAPE